MQFIAKKFAIKSVSTTLPEMLLCVGLALYVPASAARARVDCGQRYVGTVGWVVDGDTVWVRERGSDALLKVRMLGIDAPEICQQGGTASRDALHQRLHGQPVTIVTPRKRSHDDYGRLLGKVEFRGADMGRWMVQSGNAWSYRYRNSLGPYAAEQADAESARRGIFAAAYPENPRDFRKRHGSCHP